MTARFSPVGPLDDAAFALRAFALCPASFGGLWLRGPGERNAPIEPLFRAAHPPRAPLSVDAAVKTLVDALIESKGWMRSYADALVRSAIDRDEWPPRAPLTDEEIKSIFCRSVKAAELDGGFPHIFARAVLAASGGGE